MKFSYSLLPAVLAMTVSARPIKRDVDPNLIPQFGFQSGLNPTGTGDCDGAVNGADGKPIKIPCACPPDRNLFIQQLNANVAAGHAVKNPSVQVSFPTDSSVNSQLARLNTAAVTLQNLNGPGQGCPVVSTTFSAQQKAIQAGGSAAPAPAPPATPAPAPPAQTSAAAPPPAQSPVAGQLTEDQVAAVAPPLGFTSGINPTGTGDCDGAVNGADGKPIKIPCACPPAEDVYISQLTANVNAGKAINNPTVKVSYPLDNSKNSQLARLNAAAVTLQNLNGPGKGCPVVSTTFSAQDKAISNGQPLPPSAAPAAPAPAKTTAAAPVKSTPAPAAPVKSTSAPAAPAKTSAAAAPAQSSVAPAAGQLTEDQVSAVAPPLGFTSGINPTGTGDCDGAVNGSDGKPIKIPCACPPSEDVYIAQLTANANAGEAINNPTVKISYPLDDSKNSQLARLNAAAVTIQNLNGPGQGCPVVSTTFSAQNQAINAGQPLPPSAAPAAPAKTTAAAPAKTPAAAAPATTSAAAGGNNASSGSSPANSGDAAIAALVPDLGFTAGVNPKGNGNCDGAVNGADGKPIQVPCSCPPDRDTFTQSLIANVDAGHAVNNPSVGVTFPLDNSKSALVTRLQASIVTLQNLNGSGKGCPAASTTLSAQLAAALALCLL